MVVEQVLESLMGVHLGETAVEDSNADTLAVDAELVELAAAHADQLVGEIGEGGRVGRVGLVRLVGLGGWLHVRA